MLTRAIAAKPDNADAYHNLGIALNAIGKTQEAVASYRNALAINPELAETHNNLGVTQCKLGNVQEGIAEYRRALAIRSDFFDAHVNLGLRHRPRVFVDSDDDVGGDVGLPFEEPEVALVLEEVSYNLNYIQS